MDEIAGIKIVVEAEDRASAVISSVDASVSELGKAQSAVNGQTAAFNAAMNGSAKSSTVLGSSVTQTKNNLKQLETGLESQKTTTLEYTKSLRDSATALREKHTAVRNAATAYKTNTASIKENISGLESQRTRLDALTSVNDEIISRATEQNKNLKKNSTAYKENAETIKRVRAENKEYAAQRKEITQSISDNEAALKKEATAYHDAQAAVKNAAATHSEMRDKVQQSKAIEADYISTISKTNTELESQQREYEKIQKAESLIETGSSWKQVGGAVDDITKPIQYASVAIAGLGTASAMAAVKFEDNFASVKKTVDGTPEQLEQIRQELIDMSTVGIDGHRAIPLTTAELTELAAAGGQLGIATENISSFTETMAMLGTATNLSGEAGAQTLARFMNVTNTSQDEIANLGSAIVDLGNNFATTEAEIADMALSMGSTGALIGVSAQDTLAYATAMSSMGIDAAAGGSSLQRIWLDIQTAVSAGGKDLENFAKVSGKTSKEFAEQWGSDASKAYRDFLQGLGSKSTEEQVNFLSDLGFNNVRDQRAILNLAGEKGFDLLTDAIERSNTAWSENTALQTEFDAKAETTASQLAVAKNNVVEAARSFGEIMLPSIVSVTGGLSGMMQGLASTSDGTKKLVVGAGAAVVGLGALSKGAASTIKTVGGVAESVGKLKKVAQGTDAVAKLASGFLSIGSAAAPAAIAIVATTAATVGLYKAARAYEDYKADWSRGGEEMAESIRNHVSATRELNDLQYELRSLQKVVNNPETDESILNTSKARIEEIKKLLSEKYNLDITVNDSELDAALEKAKQIQLLESKQEIPDLLEYVNGKESDYNTALSDQAFYKNNIEKIKQHQKATENLKGELLLLKDAYETGSISQDEYTASFNKLIDSTGNTRFKDMPLDILLNSDAIDVWSKHLEQALTNNNTWLSESEATIAEFTGTAQDLANTGLLELEFGDTEQGISHIATAVKAADLSMNDWAKTAAAAMSGVDSLQTAWKQAWEGDGTALDNFANDYVRSMKEFGASAEETYTGAALIRQGFHSIAEAAEKGELENVAKQATELAHKMGAIPEDKHIVINASGDVSIIENVQAAVDKVNENGDVQLTVSATGDVSMLETADKKLKELIDNNQVTITFNAQTNGFNISDLQGNKLGEITANGKIQWKNETEDYNPENKEAKVTFKKDSKEVDEYNPPNLDRTVTYHAKGDVPKPNARGTQNFSGGLALVNDDGRADPRELIIDRGRAFIPEGRDVVLPLSRGAKVYTSEQTKAIMSGLGIARYASGKNNSDAFTAAKDDWSHYTKTHSVTTSQELEKWLEFQEKYKKNEKDIWDIEEQVFSLQKKLYSERVSESEKWLRHEEKYNGMSVSDYLAGIDRMKAYTAEYYAQGIINHEEYTEAIADLDEKYLDKRKEQLSGQYDQSSDYISEHTYFNDWGDIGDDPLDAYNRVMDRHKDALANGELTQKEYNDYASKLGSDMLSERIEQSKNWLEEQRKYFGMSDAEYVEGLERIKAYTQEYYDKGLIGRREYNEAMTHLNHSMWDEALDAYDDMLQKQQDYISDMREQFRKEEQALQDSWTVEDRKIDMSEVSAQLDIYAGAVTDRGQKKYAELEEQMKQLQRDEELYQLQVRNNATIEGLEADYKILEENKANVLNELRATDMNISGYVESLTQNISQSSSNVENLLSNLLTAFNNFQINAPSTTYADNRVVNLSTMPLSEYSKFMGGLL